MPDVPTIVPDSETRGLLALLPARARALAQLARFDRPIGAWLLFWPGAWAIGLAGHAVQRWDLIAWFFVGSVAMRGAGCVYNDIVDRDLDARVERTRSRPLPSGQVSVAAAWAFLGALCLVGLVVLLQLNRMAQATALASLALVAAYPFMKRITGWPQAWLGLVFTWAAMVGWPAATGRFEAAGLLLYAGAIPWCVGYDTIYALQDREDDALAGIGSSALSLGRHARLGVVGFYLAALVLWGAALWQVRPQPLALAALLPTALQLGWQALGLNLADGGDALRRFRSNRFLGLLVFLACLVVGGSA